MTTRGATRRGQNSQENENDVFGRSPSPTAGQSSRSPDEPVTIEFMQAKTAMYEAEVRAKEAEVRAKEAEVRAKEVEMRAKEASVRASEREIAMDRERLEIERERARLRNDGPGSEGRGEVLGNLLAASNGLHHPSAPLRDLLPRLADGDDDVIAFFVAFEKVCSVQELDEARWASYIPALLNSKARLAYSRLSGEECKEYAKIKKAVLGQYRLTPGAYLDKFRNSSKQFDETFVQYLARMRDLQTYYHDCKEINTYERLRDDNLGEQFKRMLGPDLRTYVDERLPEGNPGAMAELCDQYMQAHKRKAWDVTKYKNGNGNSNGGYHGGNKASPASKGVVAKRNNGSGSNGGGASSHYREERSGTGGKASDHHKGKEGARSAWWGDTCFNCGERGHRAALCSKPSRLAPKAACRVASHLSSLLDNFMFKVKIGDRDCVALRDSACDTVLINTDLVPHSSCAKGIGREVVLANGAKEFVPVVTIDLQSDEFGPNKCLTVDAGVLKGLPCDVIVGNIFSNSKVVDPIGAMINKKIAKRFVKPAEVGVCARVETRSMAKSTDGQREVMGEGQEPKSVQPSSTDVIGNDDLSQDMTQLFDEKLTGDIVDMTTDDSGPNVHKLPDDKVSAVVSDSVTTTSNDFVPKGHDGDTVHVDKSDQVVVDDDVAQTGHEVMGDDINICRGSKTFLEAQKADRGIEGCWEKARGGLENFSVRDGILYKKISTRSIVGDDWKLVLPQTHRAHVLKQAHDSPWSGHLGRRKTWERIKAHFYWPQVGNDVTAYVRSCLTCQKLSRKAKKDRAPLQNIPLVSEPFTELSLDFIGPIFPPSSSGKRFVLVVTDNATRWPEAVAMTSQRADKVADELMAMFSRLGVPRIIRSDRGSNFTSQLVTELEKRMGCAPRFTTPFHPMANGQCERFNQTLKSMLKSFMTDEPKRWCKLLPYLLFAYREVPNQTTKFSPFELVYGRTVRGPLRVLRESWTAEEDPGGKLKPNVYRYLFDLRQTLEKCSAKAVQNASESQADYKKWYDRFARTRSFQPGQRVLVLLPSSTNRMLAQWQGPFTVIRKVNTMNYEIDLGHRHTTLHVNMLKLVEERAPVIANVVLLDENFDDHEDQYPLNNLAGESMQSIGEPGKPGNLTAQQQKQLDALLAKHADIFGDKPGRTHLICHKIKLKDNEPVTQRAYRIPDSLKRNLEEEINQLLAQGLIEESDSAYASPVVYVRKKDGSLRLCVDYRQINAKCHSNIAYPMQDLSSMLEKVSRSRFISTFDLLKCYWQIPMDESSKDKTAFRTHMGLYQFTVMPFGLSGAPSTCQRLLDKVLRGAQDYACAYLDDVAVVSETWEDHLAHLDDVFKRLRNAGLIANKSKCQFVRPSIKYLGHVISDGHMRPDDDKVSAVKAFPRPTTKTGVRAYLGLTGYYRKFIPDYAKIAVPLSDLTRKDRPDKVIWGEREQKAFDALKDLLTKDPVLQAPNPDLPYVLQTDASQFGVGAVISQTGPDGKEHPVGYASRKLLPRESRYSTVEKECLAIIWALAHFESLIYGKKVVVQTDHNPLVWLKTVENRSPRLTRWALSLQPYSVKMEYRKGSANGNADGLSRA
jgi:transposase InsO family protein